MCIAPADGNRKQPEVTGDTSLKLIYMIKKECLEMRIRHIVDHA
jgi:hypothetical protein